MPKQFMLRIITPEKTFFTGDVESLIFTTLDGQRGVLADHVAMVVALATAQVSIKTDSGWRLAALSGGFAQVTDDHVSIFADTVEWPEDIEESRALAAKKRAEERLHSKIDNTEYLRSQAALQRALVRLSLKKKD